MVEEQAKESFAAVAESPYLEAALRYAEKQKWCVFPVKADKEPLGSLVRHGHNDATKDKTKIQEWWEKEPGANVGVRTGAASGIIVLDVDMQEESVDAKGKVTAAKDGFKSLSLLEDRCGKLPETVTCLTPSGGKHFYFSHPGGAVKCAVNLPGFPGLDIRGDGGYVVTAPSVIDSYKKAPEGGCYAWEESRGPGEIPIAPIPAGLLGVLTSPKVKRATPAINPIEKKQAEGAYPIGPGEFIVDGTRNSTLTSMAGVMRQKGFCKEAMLAALLAENRGCCTPPLDEGEVAKIVESIYKYPLNDYKFSYIENLVNRANPDRKPGIQFTPLPDLLSEPDKDPLWLVDEILPVAGFSILASKPKIGKSTFSRNLALSVACGEDFLGRKVRQGAVLYLALGMIRPHEKQVYSRMGMKSPNLFVGHDITFTCGVEDLAKSIIDYKPVLAVVDNLFSLVKIENGNDYAEVDRKLEPALTIARASGCHLLFICHTGKGDHSGGDAILGSTAFFGKADTTIRLSAQEDHRRVIAMEGQYGQLLPETILDFDPKTHALALVESLEEARLTKYGAMILKELGGKKMTEPEIKAAVGGNRTHTANALREMVRNGVLERTEQARSGKPYLYWNSLLFEGA